MSIQIFGFEGIRKPRCERTWAETFPLVPQSVCSLQLPLDFDQADAVRARLVYEQITSAGHPHVPYNADSGGNDPALKFLSLRIEANQRVGSHSRLVVPNDVVRDR